MSDWLSPNPPDIADTLAIIKSKRMKEVLSNYGILASISWNSNNWTDNPSEEDIKASKYDYVKDNSIMHESLNFGIDKFPVEQSGYYIGYTPMFNRPPTMENSKNVTIVFFTSSDYKNSNRKAIVGFYGYPEFGETYYKSDIPKQFEMYNYGNIKAKPKDIIYFENPIIIDNDSVKELQLLPPGKKISQQGFNYLNSDNVFNLVKIAFSLNSSNLKLKSFVEKFPIRIEVDKENIITKEYLATIMDCDADEVSGIIDLENKMKGKVPEVKQRISNYIERGSISNKVKKWTNYKCLICEAKSMNPYSFISLMA